MAWLSEIIREIETRFQLKVYGNYQKNHTIDGIHFLTENDARISHLSPNVLYLAAFPVYGDQALYGDVLFTDCGEGVPEADSLYIKESPDLLELYHVIADHLLAYRQIEARKDSLFRILHNGQGMDALLQAAYKYLNNPIVLCDSSYTVLSSYPEVEDEIYLEPRNHRLSLKSIFTEDMKERKITDHIYHSVYPLTAKVENYPYDWIFQSVRIKRAVVGYVCVKCTERNYTDYDLELIHSLTQMISIQLQKDDTYRNPQGIKYDMFLKELAAGHFTDEEGLEKQLALLGMKTRSHYYLAASGFTNDAQKLMAYDYYLRQLSSILPDSITGVFGNRFITLVSTDDMQTLTEEQESRLETFLTMNHMITTVSYLYDRLTESFAYFAQCNDLLTQKLAAYNPHPILHYKDHYLRHLADSLNRKELAAASIHPSIRFMKDYDTLYHTEYYHTMEAFFDNNRNAQSTANALFIHKSTLFYRFDKMKKLFHIHLDDKDALFSYEYSLKLMKITTDARS